MNRRKIVAAVLLIGIGTILFLTIRIISFPREKSNENNNQEEAPDAAADETDRLTEEEKTDRRIREILGEMSLDEKLAQLFLITPEALGDFEPVTAAGEELKKAYFRFPVGGFIYFSENLQDPQQVKTLLSSLQEYAGERTGLPLFQSIDEEGGTVVRIGEKADVFQVPVVGNMCDIKSAGEAYRAGSTIGAYLSALGFNLNYDPDADVLSNPENTVVKYRSFGSDPLVVSQLAMSKLEGLKDQNVIGVLKHFPGHGATKGDTHKGYAYTDASLEDMLANELIPFQTGIRSGAEIIMAGHISCPDVLGDDIPASLSKYMITDVLKEKLGFQGLVITDALNMGAVVNEYTSAEAAVKAVESGVDLLLMPDNFNEAFQGLKEAVENHHIPIERIEDSVYKIIKKKIFM